MKNSNMSQTKKALKNNPKAWAVEITDIGGTRVEIKRDDLDIVHTEIINSLQVRKMKVIFGNGSKKAINTSQ